MSFLLLTVSVLPVILLMVFIYRQDKYEKEPIRLLVRAFIGGVIAIPLDLVLVTLVNSVFYSETVFHAAFIEAGFCEELSKFLLLFLFIWWNKNFNEYMDGIVYATFVGLGFACVENIMYVAQGGLGTGIVRAFLSVPGHFLFGVIMGYFFALAKFSKNKRFVFLLLSLFTAAAGHGLFDWLLMVNDGIPNYLSAIFVVLFFAFDIWLWRTGVKYIRRLQENSQFKNQDPLESFTQISSSDEPEYKKIDWDAGNKF